MSDYARARAKFWTIDQCSVAGEGLTAVPLLSTDLRGSPVQYGPYHRCNRSPEPAESRPKHGQSDGLVWGLSRQIGGGLQREQDPAALVGFVLGSA